MSEVSGNVSVSSDELGFLSDFIFVDEDKRPVTAAVQNSETTAYDSEFDEVSSSTSDDVTVPSKKSKQPNESLDSSNRTAKRKERNRLGARNTRAKKKQYIENLQGAISRMADENDVLNAQILCLNTALNQSSSTLFHARSCDGDGSSSSNSNSSSSGGNCSSTTVPPTMLEAVSASESIQSTERALILTDPALRGNPTIFASQGFLTLTGYDLSEVLGRNPRMLQGPGTDPQLVDMLSNNVKFGIPVTTRLLNFKRGKVPFYNHVSIAPLRDNKGRMTNFVGTMFEEKGKKVAV